MAKLKIDDLKKIKENVQRTVTLRDGTHRAKITVHMGTCGIASGARTIMSAFMQEIEKNNLTDIILTTSGCAGLCSKEPMATIEIKGATPVKYIELTEEKAKKIFKDHIIDGNPVNEFAIAQGSETTY